MYLFDELKLKLENKHVPLVFPEGNDIRIIEATLDLEKEGHVYPLVIGDPQEIEAVAKEHNLDISPLEIINPHTYEGLDTLVDSFVARRKGKINAEDAKALLLKDANYFGTMLVYDGHAQGLISGAAHSTADTIRPGLQIIKMKEGLTKASGIFIMVKGDERLFMADCAININPTSEDLAEIAKVSSITAKQFGVEPKVGLLSFSTKGSAKSEETEKVTKALEIAQTKYPELVIDGELQFDTAYVPSVAKTKAKDSKVAGIVNTFVFPTLDAGNIGYKIAQRLGGYEAIGPVLQGMNKPVNDLSRGCNAKDVYNLALITAVQAVDQ